MKNSTNQEEITKELLKLLEERGKKALELARKIVLEEKIETKMVKEALKYFMTECWHDVTRPALISLVCEAVGGDPEITTPIGISITLISGATGIHDDIIDQSERKASRLTVPGKYGEDIALLVGDALLFKGFTTLCKAVEKGISPKKIATISEIINRTFIELGDAEALTLQFRGRKDVTPEDYLSIVRKRSADIEAYTRISAILGDGSEEEIEILGEYGRILGMLVILRDDMIDMLDVDELVHRIEKEYLSLPIIYALQNPKMNSIIGSFFKKKLTTKNAERLAILVDQAGGFTSVHLYMKELAKDAYNILEKINLNKNNLALLIRGMLLPEWKSYLCPEVSNR